MQTKDDVGKYVWWGAYIAVFSVPDSYLSSVIHNTTTTHPPLHRTQGWGYRESTKYKLNYKDITVNAEKLLCFIC